MHGERNHCQTQAPDLALPRYSTDMSAKRQGMSPSPGTQLPLQSPVTSARAPSIDQARSGGSAEASSPLCAGRQLDSGQASPLVRAPERIPTL